MIYSGTSSFSCVRIQFSRCHKRNISSRVSGQFQICNKITPKCRVNSVRHPNIGALKKALNSSKIIVLCIQQMTEADNNNSLIKIVNVQKDPRVIVSYNLSWSKNCSRRTLKNWKAFDEKNIEKTNKVNSTILVLLSDLSFDFLFFMCTYTVCQVP